MSKFKRTLTKGSPAVSTASLPDIVFMLLFFFMVATVMRETDLKVKLEVPQATELTKLEDRSLIDYIYVGTPYETEIYGSASRIQLADQFASIDEIQQYITDKREARNEGERPFVTVSLKVDKESKMGIVTDVKQELRKCQALKILYSSYEPGESE